MNEYEMTSNKLEQCPKGMSDKERYELLSMAKFFVKRAEGILEKIKYEGIALEVLADEKGSAKYQMHYDKREELFEVLKAIRVELQTIFDRLKQD